MSNFRSKLKEIVLESLHDKTCKEICFCESRAELVIDQIIELVKGVIGEQEEAGSTAVKTLTLSALVAATKALEFHARNKLKKEQLAKLE